MKGQDLMALFPKGSVASSSRSASKRPSPSGAIARARLAAGEDARSVVKGMTHGFGSLGEQLTAIARACYQPERAADKRLVRAPTGAGEADPSTGGFLVAPQWAEELVGFAYEEAVIAPLCDRRRTAKPLSQINVPAIDETSRADGSRWGGALAYWDAEGATISPNFPRFKNIAFSPKKLFVIAYATDELLADVPMLEAHMRRVFSAEMGFKLDLAVLSGGGPGLGQPLGILNSGALITVAKETGQAPATIVAANVRKMWTSLPAPSRRTAVWLVNEQTEEQLEQMTTIIGSSGAAAPTASALYVPAGAGGNAFPLLKGRPVLVVEQCPVLGALGDIVLADLRHYVNIDGGINLALSLDVSFLNDQAVFRFVLRVDGGPVFTSPITSYQGSAQRSPFVALASR